MSVFLTLALSALSTAASGLLAVARWAVKVLLTSPHAAAGLSVALAAAAYWFPDLGYYAAIGGLPATAGLLLWFASDRPVQLRAALSPPTGPTVTDDLISGLTEFSDSLDSDATPATDLVHRGPPSLTSLPPLPPRPNPIDRL